MKIFFPLSLLFFLIASCSKDTAINPDTIMICDSSSVSYNGNIKHILDNNCALSGCHDAATATNGYNFSDYTHSKHIGNALDNINQTNGAISMPPAPATKLPDSLIVQITQWVENGYCE